MVSTLEEPLPAKARWAIKSTVPLQTMPWIALIQAGVSWKSSPGALGRKTGLQMAEQIWVLEFSRLAHSQLRAVWANSRGGAIYCMRLTFGRVYLQSGSSLNSFPFCNHLGYGAVILLIFHLRFCFCLKSHLKRVVVFLLRAGCLLVMSTRQLMSFRALGGGGEERHGRQLTAHPDISLSLVCKIL